MRRRDDTAGSLTNNCFKQWVCMNEDALEMPALRASLKELDLALGELRHHINQANESSRQALQCLEKDEEDLERLANMATEWMSEVDIFDVLRLDGSEEFHSNFLAWLLRPRASHGLGPYFLREFLRDSGAPGVISAPAIGDTTVNREQNIVLHGENGRLDIRILSEESRFLCAIENKMWSPESGTQLNFYRMALAAHYSDYSVRRVFLTPNGAAPDDPEEREHWTTMTYTDILRLVERTLEEGCCSVNEDVKTLLRQYATTLRRNIVPEVSEDVHRLARAIYRKHKQAIDLIIEHRDRYEPNYVTEGFRMVRDAVGERPEWRESRCNRPYARFVSADWSNNEELGVDGWPDHLLQFQVQVTNHGAELSLFLSWHGNGELKKKIYDGLNAHPELFSGEFPGYADDYITLRVGNILEGLDYENWWDEERTREIISRRLDEFAHGNFPQINRIVMECLEQYGT